MKKILSAILTALTLFTMCSCARPERNIPVITYEDKKVYVDGKYITTSDWLYVYRIDEKVVSFTTKDGCFNLNADGSEIKLSDVITDRDHFEETIGHKICFRVATMDRVLEYDVGPIIENVSSYDVAMKMPFILSTNGVEIICRDGEGHSVTAYYSYDDDGVSPDFHPGDGVTCSRWMTGKVGCGIPDIIIDGYEDYWAESSLMVENYGGKNYIWFCIRFTDDSGKDTYYSIVVEEREDSDRKMIYSQVVDGSFVCCDISEFSRIINAL